MGEDASRRYEIRSKFSEIPVVSIGKCDVKSIFLSSGGGSIVRFPFSRRESAFDTGLLQARRAAIVNDKVFVEKFTVRRASSIVTD